MTEQEMIDVLWEGHKQVEWTDQLTGEVFYSMDKKDLAEALTEYDKALRDAIKKKVDGFAFTPADRRTIKYIIRNTEVKP